jgi:hypothetical protein
LVYGTSGRLRQRKGFNDLKNLAPNGVHFYGHFEIVVFV